MQYFMRERNMAAGRYVLLAEDNQVNQEVGRAMLESLGCRVDIAGNGREALSLLESTKYDLILMDCQMPLMNGWEATMKIRENENPNIAGIAVVALTAHIKEGDREECLAAGMDDYLSKPFRLYELSDMVERWAGRGTTLVERAGNSDKEESRRPPGAASEAPADRMEGSGCIECGVLENLKSTFGACGQDMLAGVIRIYISDSPALLDRMGKALQNGDSNDMFKAAHALKSSSANLGANGLAGLCASVEDIARMGSTEGSESIIVRIHAEYEKVRVALEGERERGV
jgi:two-component system, sensor histidine kinase and response regulator